MAGLRYRVAGSDVYRYPGDPGIALGDVLSPSAHLSVFLNSWFDHIYHSAILTSPNPLCSLIIRTKIYIGAGASQIGKTTYGSLRSLLHRIARAIASHRKWIESLHG